MGQPVKLSDELVLDARLTGEVFQRSIAGQVEFWARLGRTTEELLHGRKVLELARDKGGRPLYEVLETVDSPAGRARLAKHLETIPFPHYAAFPGRPGMLIRTDANGDRSIGRFVNREFVIEQVEDAELTSRAAAAGR
jgi:hypothetical protein